MSERSEMSAMVVGHVTPLAGLCDFSEARGYLPARKPEPPKAEPVLMCTMTYWVKAAAPIFETGHTAKTTLADAMSRAFRLWLRDDVTRVKIELVRE